jgi:hypothetical protein
MMSETSSSEFSASITGGRITRRHGATNETETADCRLTTVN